MDEARDGQRIDMTFAQKLIEALGLQGHKIASISFEATGGQPPVFTVGIFVTAEMGGLVCALVKDQRYRLQPDGAADTMTMLERPATPE
jgi:hypothetical protein